MIRNIWKYFFCTAVALVITGSVILLPYAYYSINDAKSQNNYEIDEFKIASTVNNISAKAALEALRARDSIFIENGNTLSDDELFKKVNSALSSFEECLTPDSPAKAFLQLYDENSEKILDNYKSAIIISGTSEDTPASISTVYVEFETNILHVCVTLNSESNKIYQLNIAIKESEVPMDYYDENSEITAAYNSLKSFYQPMEVDDTNNANDKEIDVKETYVKSEQTAYNDILKYWNENDVEFIIEINDNMFSFY